jgi:hypothetical protein
MDYATAKMELDSPPSEWFSSQKITFTDGEVAELKAGDSSATAPTTGFSGAFLSHPISSRVRFGLFVGLITGFFVFG